MSAPARAMLKNTYPCPPTFILIYQTCAGCQRRIEPSVKFIDKFYLINFIDGQTTCAIQAKGRHRS